MIAFRQDMRAGSTTSKFFGELGHSRYSAPKSKGHAELHAVIYGEGRQLESCSRDPIGLIGGGNFYAYVWLQPLRLVDPSGLIAFRRGDYSGSGNCPACGYPGEPTQFDRENALGARWLFSYLLRCQNPASHIEWILPQLPPSHETTNTIFGNPDIRSVANGLKDAAIAEACANGTLSGTMRQTFAVDTEPMSLMEYFLGTTTVTVSWKFVPINCGCSKGYAGAIKARLKDDIDALSLLESYRRGHFSAGWGPAIAHLLEVLVDLGCEKSMGGGFTIDVSRTIMGKTCCNATGGEAE